MNPKCIKSPIIPCIDFIPGATASVDEVRKDVNTLRSGQEKLGGRLDAVEGIYKVLYWKSNPQKYNTKMPF